ncbi:MAG: hypothetical protein WCH35_17645, partial [Comamonadaceae bacterium]
VPIPDDQYFEDLTFAATVREAKAVLRIAETSSLSWLALEPRACVKTQVLRRFHCDFLLAAGQSSFQNYQTQYEGHRFV